MTQGIVKRVNHLIVRAHDAGEIYKTFNQLLLLPQAWPVSINPLYVSGGVHLGNINLEILQVGQQRRPAQLYGIAFELSPYEHSLPELRKRSIPHTPPQPFYQVDDQGWRMVAWTSVYLGGLLGDHPLAKMFFNLSQRAPSEQWEKGSLPTPFNRRFGLPFVYDTIYRNGITFSVEYNPAWYGQNINIKPAGSGLDVQRVYEVKVGTQDNERTYAYWQALLNPYPEIRPGIWKLPEDIHIRLVSHPKNELLGMIWQVRSTNRAAQFLHKRQMLGKEKDGMVRISPKRVHGLDIRLVQ